MQRSKAAHPVVMISGCFRFIVQQTKMKKKKKTKTMKFRLKKDFFFILQQNNEQYDSGLDNEGKFESGDVGKAYPRKGWNLRDL